MRHPEEAVVEGGTISVCRSVVRGPRVSNGRGGVLHTRKEHMMSVLGFGRTSLFKVWLVVAATLLAAC